MQSELERVVIMTANVSFGGSEKWVSPASDRQVFRSTRISARPEFRPVNPRFTPPRSRATSFHWLTPVFKPVPEETSRCVFHSLCSYSAL